MFSVRRPEAAGSVWSGVVVVGSALYRLVGRAPRFHDPLAAEPDTLCINLARLAPRHFQTNTRNETYLRSLFEVKGSCLRVRHFGCNFNDEEN